MTLVQSVKVGVNGGFPCAGRLTAIALVLYAAFVVARGERAGGVARSLVAVLAALLLAAKSSSAATIVVDTLNDIADPPFNADGFCGVGQVADLPGADGHISLREAIIAANNSAAPNTILFAEALRGGTIQVDFDDLDADTKPDMLPVLCGGGVTIDGDIDHDGAADITIDGSALTGQASGFLLASSDNQIRNLHIQAAPFAGVGVLHVATQSVLPGITGNVISGNTITASNYGIFVIAGSTSPMSSGSIDATEISGNVVGATTQYDGIFVSTAPVAGSTVSATTIADNHVSGAQRHGVYILASYAPDGATTSITDTTVRNNEIFDNQSQGVSVSSYAGRAHTIRGLAINNNDIYENGSVGISLAAGVCGATDCVLEATVSNNIVKDNGQQDRGPGMILIGGSNYACSLTLSSLEENNRLSVTAEQNTLSGNLGGHIAVIGGYVGASSNSAAVTLTQNSVGSGLVGIAILGGMGTVNDQSAPANGNSVRAALSGNTVDMAIGGILLAGGSSGPANDNRVEVVVENNSSCGSTASDLSCVGGFPGLVGFPTNTGTGNVVNGIIQDNEATSIIAADGVPGNSCNAELTTNRACGAPTPTPTVAPGPCVGDCDASGDVTIDEL
ncbi:MAG TPA: hypothetical protein VMT89_12175, partial [Candidatus Acidoferrales bacterium]|nr:hypothetical protein [Candidatus Acidoferrales bacterium]